MKSKTTLRARKNAVNQPDKESTSSKSPVIKKYAVNKVYAELVEKGHADFYSYLEWLGLSKRTDLLILTSSQHYYFEVDDLKNIKAVLNLNQLNSIKRIRDFLQTVYCVIPQQCYFIGSYTDNKSQNVPPVSKKALHQIDSQGYIPELEEGPWSSFFNMLYGLIDPKTNRNLNKKTVQFMLEDSGLKILDITEFNGLTYFCTQKVNSSVE